MKCARPVWLEFYHIMVPCGRCASCKVAHSREWAVRLLHELDEYNGKGLFVTLTYSTENLPPNKSISKEELQKFFKRLRKRLNGKIIKYFACGEYGEKHDRPHYHAIIINLGLEDKDKVQASWDLGLIHAGTVTVQSCKYVGNYIQKKQSLLYLSMGMVPPFQLQSLGIGKQFALRNAEQIYDNLGITQNGKNVGIPRYYKKILGFGEREFGASAMQRNEEENAKISEQTSNDYVAEALIAANRRQTQLNTLAKLKLAKDFKKSDR